MEFLGDERGLGGEHPVDRMKELPHDGDVGLERGLPARDELSLIIRRGDQTERSPK